MRDGAAEIRLKAGESLIQGSVPVIAIALHEIGRSI
jgi:hypothetical protein